MDTLLGEAGFGDIVAYAGVPGYNDPNRLVPLDDDRTLRFYFQEMMRPRSALLRLSRAAGGELWWPLELRLRRFLAPSILLVAYPAETPPGGES